MKKSSGAAATEKVAPLVAPAGEQRRCAHHWCYVIRDKSLTNHLASCANWHNSMQKIARNQLQTFQL